MKRRIAILISFFVVAAVIVFLVSLQGPTLAFGDDDDGDEDVIVVDLFSLFGPGAGATGIVVIDENPAGPDELKLQIAGLPADERITVFLTTHQGPGRLPAQFIGEFTTDDDGEGELELEAEIVSAFASANQMLEDPFGEADDPLAGRLPVPLGGMANTIPLNWFRGYFVDIFPHNVFGPDENTAGGAIAFLSSAALP